MEQATAQERESYKWASAAADLALGTQLTINEASRIVYHLTETRLHPYDALPHLMRLFGTGEAQEKGLALKALVAPGTSAEPVIDRDGIRVYATDAGRYVAADRAGWVEGTYGTPEEAWTAGAPGE